MARKPSREDLENEIANLRPYQEAFFLLNAGHRPETFTSGEESVRFLGGHRASGGVVLIGDGSSVRFAFDWCAQIDREGDPYRRELASKIRRRHQSEVEYHARTKPCQCGDGSCVLCDDNGRVVRE